MQHRIVSQEEWLTARKAHLRNDKRWPACAIFARLASGAATITEVTERFEMNLPAVSKHLKVLKRAGLNRTSWSIASYRARSGSLAAARPKDLRGLRPHERRVRRQDEQHAKVPRFDHAQAIAREHTT